MNSQCKTVFSTKELHKHKNELFFDPCDQVVFYWQNLFETKNGDIEILGWIGSKKFAVLIIN